MYAYVCGGGMGGDMGVDGWRSVLFYIRACISRAWMLLVRCVGWGMGMGGGTSEVQVIDGKGKASDE